MAKKKVWDVKCPRCKKIWQFRDDGLVQGPMYKYCKGCSKIESETGKAVFRASMGSFPFSSGKDDCEE